MSAELRQPEAPATAADSYAATIPVFDPAEAERISAMLDATLPRVHESEIHALIEDETAVATVCLALFAFARHPHIARVGSAILRSVCRSEAGRAAACASSETTEDVTVRGATVEGLLHAAILHPKDEDTVVDALGALVLLVNDHTTQTKQIFSEPRCLVIIADLLWRHASDDRPDAAKSALHIIATCSHPKTFIAQLADRGFVELAQSLLSKHMNVPSIAQQTALILSHVFPVAPPPPSKAAELAALLMAAVRLYDRADDAAFDESDTAPSAVVASTVHAIGWLTRLVPSAGEYLMEGANAFQLVGCLRRHMANLISAAAACSLLTGLAKAKSQAFVTRLVLAGAVPLLLSSLEAHEATPQLVFLGCEAFWYFAHDAATRLELAQEEPVRLLLRLLRRHIGDSKLAHLLAECLRLIAKEETGCTLLFDGDAAPETIALLLEVARAHKDATGARSPVAAAFAVISVACTSYDRIAAAHKAGVGAAALSALRATVSRPDDEAAAVSLCEILGNISCYHEGRADLFKAGAPALVLQALKRYSTSADLPSAAWGMLRQIAVDPGELGRHPKLLDEALPLLLDALEHNWDCPITVAGASSFFCWMLDFGRPSACNAAARSAPLLLRALRAHPGDDTVALVVLGALSRVAAASPAGARAVLACKALADAVAALSKHGGSDPVIASCAARLLDELAGKGCSGGAAELSRPGMIEAVLPAAARALRHRITDDFSSNCVRHSVGVLCKLADVPSNRPHYARVGVIPGLLGLLKRYGEGGEGETADVLAHAASLAAVTLYRAAPSEACLALMRTLKAQDVLVAVLARVDDSKGRAEVQVRDAITRLLPALGPAA